MHMTKKSSNVNESSIRISYWSYCLAIVFVFAIADVVSGGLIRESVVGHIVEFALVLFSMIVIIGDYASDGPPGLKFVRACSRHKL